MCFFTATKINDELQEKIVSCLYLSVHSEFWALTIRLYRVDSAYKFLCVRYFF